MEEEDLQTPLLPLRSPPIHPQQNGSPTPGIQMQCGETECRTIRWKQRGAICTNCSEGAVSEDKTQAYDSVFAVADLDLVDSLCYSTIILSWVSMVLYGALASPLLHSCVVQESL